MKTFGRDPTLWIALITAALGTLVTFNISGLSGTQSAWIVAAINAVGGAVAAWRTRPIAPQAFLYLTSSLIGLAGAYGLHLSDETVGSVNGLVLAVLMFLVRGQVSPAEDAHLTGVLGPHAVSPRPGE